MIREQYAMYFALPPRRIGSRKAMLPLQDMKPAKASGWVQGLGQRGYSAPLLQLLHGAGPGHGGVCSLDAYYFPCVTAALVRSFLGSAPAVSAASATRVVFLKKGLHLYIR